MPKPKQQTVLTAATRAIVRLIERRSPDVHRNEWVALAIEAARRGGLPEPEIQTIRTWFRLQRSVDAEESAKGEEPQARRKFRQCDPVKRRDGTGVVMTVDAVHGDEVEVIWATTAGISHTETVPADQLELA